MIEQTDYLIFLLKILLIFIILFIFIYIKREIFKSIKSAFLLILIGLCISISTVIFYTYFHGSFNINKIISFLLLKNFDDSWVLTRNCAFGYGWIFGGIVALFFALSKKRQIDFKSKK